LRDLLGVITDERMILLADPDPESRGELCEALVAAGYFVRAVATGMEAAQILIETVPRLIVLDLDLKWLSGRQLIEILKSHHHTARIPIIALVTFPIHLPGTTVLLRPIDPNRLLAVVDRVSAGHDLHRDHH
jgi:CheY-like chemotaxis protein